MCFTSLYCGLRILSGNFAQSKNQQAEESELDNRPGLALSSLGTLKPRRVIGQGHGILKSYYQILQVVISQTLT